jgi:hypothetical protein
MSSRITQRTVYLVTAVIVASMVGGFALATMQLGQTNNSYQGSQTTTVSSVAGLTWLNTTLAVNNNTAPAFATCTLAVPCNLHTSGYTVCAGGFPTFACAQSDFVEQVIISVSAVTAIPTGAVELTVYVTGTPTAGSQGTYAGPILYFTESATPAVTENIVLDFDVGAPGPGAVTSISVIATT